MTQQDVTDAVGPQIEATGHYDGESGTLTVTAALDGCSMTAVYDGSDEGASALDLLWNAFPGVIQAVVENLEEQSGHTVGIAASNA